jgi:murein DD-endopeptidase MepM/ murein hydrolase activator NlpD
VSEAFTILIVPERSSAVRRITVPKRWVLRASIAGLFLLASFIVLFVTYVHMLTEYNENPKLKNENSMLKARLQSVSEEVNRINVTLQHVDALVVRLRTITKLHDPARKLAMGPLDDASASMRQVAYAPDERIESEDEMLDSKLAVRLVESEAEAAKNQALQEETKLQDLSDFFAANVGLLAAVPMIRPTHAKALTSRFGVRSDPYTDRQVMHKGVDFAAEQGSDVIAPADGIVVFAGNAGAGYGNKVVLNHGFGLQTHFAHLDQILVELGARAKRGEVFAKVGNTGRTTGAHLHYEVRLLGVPQNPEKFIFEE